jgi:hypothetical protein
MKDYLDRPGYNRERVDNIVRSAIMNISWCTVTCMFNEKLMHDLENSRNGMVAPVSDIFIELISKEIS